MNNEIQIFNYNNREVRTVQKDGEPWFVLKDVCAILGISKYRDAAERLDPDEREPVRVDTLGGKQEMLCINESGLYNVILRSDKPEAKPFRKWVTSEVLPSIRKNGGYIAGQETMTPAELMASALMVAQKTLAERDARIADLTVQNQIMLPKAEYFDDCMARGGLLNFRDTAKLLGMKQKEFIENLLRDKYLYRDKRGRLLPYEKRNNGYLEVKEAFNTSSDWNGVQTLITPKGREFFRSLYPCA